ncbi:hypothetical protein PCE1_000064 [Barthelona sp. PCE]
MGHLIFAFVLGIILLSSANAMGFHHHDFCNQTTVNTTDDGSTDVTPDEIWFSDLCPHCLEEIDVCITTPVDPGVSLHYMIDVSQSFLGHIQQVSDISKEVLAHFDNEIDDFNVAISSFSDYGQLFTNDSPYTLLLNLTESDDPAINTTLDNLQGENGGDTPESQLFALLQAAENSADIGFTNDGTRKFTVLLTDAEFHEDNSPMYPTAEDVCTALGTAGLTPIFLVRPNLDGDPDLISIYNSLTTLCGFGYVFAISENSTVQDIIDILTPVLSSSDTYNVTLGIQPLSQMFVQSFSPLIHMNVPVETEVCFTLSILPNRCWCEPDNVTVNYILNHEVFPNSTFIRFDPCHFCLYKYCKPHPPHPPIHPPCMPMMCMPMMFGCWPHHGYHHPYHGYHPHHGHHEHNGEYNGGHGYQDGHSGYHGGYAHSYPQGGCHGGYPYGGYHNPHGGYEGYPHHPNPHSQDCGCNGGP